MSILTKKARRTIELPSVLTCDQCGADYERKDKGWQPAIPEGWIDFTEHGLESDGQQHVCSWRCLAAYARGKRGKGR